MFRLPTALLACAAAIFAAVPASAASFRCGGHLTYTEAAICENANLSDLDSRMASLYELRHGQLRGPARLRLQMDQARWLSTRDGCGANVDCLIDVYTSRVHYLMVAY